MRFLHAIALATILLFAFGGCRESSPPIALKMTSNPPSSLPIFETFLVTFHVDNLRGNPYDPEEVNAYFQIVSPSKKQLTHSAFFTHDYQIAVRYGREVTRKMSTQHWEGRWTPTEVGVYEWKLTVECDGESVSTAGTLECTPGSSKGFARVSSTDPKYFETSDGSFFYPLGHATRSPFEDRGDLPDFDSKGSFNRKTKREGDGELRVTKYEKWFQRMSESGENFCSIWMAPWWLEIEWSPTREGYEGLGRYNQKHAAQLDQIFKLAEKYGIYILLFTTNHGRVSTVVDSEWKSNPHRKNFSTPTQYFLSSESLKAETKRHQYILARWGYSTSLFGISLCTEANWIDPYHGFQAGEGGEEIDGMMHPKSTIEMKKVQVKEWFQELSRNVKQADIHQHPISIQFAVLNEGSEFWEEPEFEFVLNNAYTNQLRDPILRQPFSKPVYGLADGMLSWSRFMSVHEKPALISEWGGHFVANNATTLETELHMGAWAISMTELGGVTGFWWTNKLHDCDMYHHLAAVEAFWGDYDRRNKDLHSDELPVYVEVHAFTESPVQPFATHPTRNAIGLYNTTEAFFYVYHHHANTSDVPATSSDSMLFPLEDEAWVALPDSLDTGTYEVEFWDTFTGRLKSRETVDIQSGIQGHVIKLPPFHVDIAAKVRRTKPLQNDISKQFP